MAVVGSAEIVVRAVTKQVRGDIEKAFKNTAPVAMKAGSDAGEDWADAFRATVQNGTRGSFDGIFDNVDASSAGTKAGSDFATAAAGGIGGGGGRIGDAAEREFGGAGRRGGGAFNRALESEFAKTSVAASKAFTGIFAMGNIVGVGLSGAVGAVSSLVSGLFAVASAASTAVGSLAVLPGIVSTLLQAGGSLKLAFSGVGKALQAGMKPAAEQAKQAATRSYAVVDAQKAVARAASSAAEARMNANRQVQDAERALAKTVADGAQTKSDADRKVADAQRSLSDAVAEAATVRQEADRKVIDASRAVADAERTLLGITRELNDARREAAESLQQLGFSAEDAALNEERAGMRLEEAHAKLVEAQKKPADDRSRREAELNYKEAELNYRQAKDRNADLAAEQKKAAKAGIEGSNEVMSVKRRIADAEQTVADKQRALDDARIDRQRRIADAEREIADRQIAVQDALIDKQRAMADVAEAIATRERALDDAKRARQQAIIDGQTKVADAQESLRRAQESAAASSTKASASTNAYAQAMNSLSPAAQTFVKYLLSIRGALDGLKAAAGIELFPRLQTALEPIVAKTFPALERQLRGTGRILGDFAIGFSDALTRGSLFEDILKSQNQTLDIFNRRGANGRTVIDDLATVMLRLLSAVQPLTQRFASWVASLIEGAEAATDTSAEMNKLTGFFDRAGDRASLLGDIVGNIIGIFAGLGRAASPAGTGLLESFEKYTASLEKFIKTPEGQESLGKYFEGVADNFTKIADLLSDVGFQFSALADNQGIGAFAESLKPAIANFGKMFDNMATASPALGELIVKLSELALVFADVGGFQIFFGVLNALLDPLVAFAKSDFGGPFLVIVGAIAAFTRALSFAGIVGGKVFQILAGGPISVMQKFSKFKSGGISGLTKSLFGLDKASDKTGRGLRGLGPASDAAKLAFERQMVTDKLKNEVLEKLERQALQTGAAMRTMGKYSLPPAAGAGAMKAAAPAASTAAVAAPKVAAVPAVMPVGNAMANTAKQSGRFAGAMSKAGGAMKGLGAAAMALVGGPIGLLIAAIAGLVFGLIALYKKSPEFKRFVDGITNAVKPVIQAIGTFLVGALDKFFGWVNDKMPTIKAFFSDVFGSISSFITNSFVPVWTTKVIPAMQTMWAVIQPILMALWNGVKLAFEGIKWTIMNVLVPAFGLIWQGLQGAWTIVQPILSALWTGIKTVFEGVKWTITNILAPAWTLVWKGLQTAWTILQPVLNALWSGIKLVFKAIGTVISWWYENIVKRYFGFVGTVFRGAGIVGAWLLKKLKSVFSAIGAAAQAMWKLISPAFTWIGSKAKWLWEKIRDYFSFILSKVRAVSGWINEQMVARIRKAFNAVSDKVSWAWRKFRDNFDLILSKARSVSSWLREQLVARVRSAFNSISEKVGWLWGKFRDNFELILSKAKSVSKWIKESMVSRIRSAFNTIKDKTDWLWDKMKVPFDKIKKGASGVKDGIVGARDGIRRAWSKLTGYIKDPIIKALKWLQDTFVKKMRSWLGKIPGVKESIIPNISIPKGWATGGWTGPGSKYQPAGIVHADEYVIRKESTKKLIKTIGLSGLDYINRTGRMPGFSAGGKVPALGSTSSRRGSGSVLPGYYIGGKVQGLDKKFLTQLAAFNKAAGGRYSVYSGYRSVAHQAQLYARYLAGRGPEAAKPGSSQHNFGLAADLAPSNARDVHAGLARKFGLVFTVPSESWHIEPTWGRSGKNKGGSFFGIDLPDWAKAPGKYVKDKVNSLLKKFEPKKMGIAGEIIPAVLSKVKTAVTSKVKSAASLFAEDGGGSGNIKVPPGSGVERWRGIVRKALWKTGQPASLADLVLMQMRTESSGNPKAINLWDSNAKRGTPSKGLMQVIGPTFRAYAMKGYASNIYDPLSNIIASIRYALANYGSLRRAYRGVGYARGTDWASSGWRLVGEEGPELVNFSGGERVFNRQQTLNLAKMTADARAGQTANTGLSTRDQAIVDTIRQAIGNGNGQSGDTINVHPSPGMDEAALALEVSRRIAWRRSVGT